MLCVTFLQLKVKLENVLILYINIIKHISQVFPIVFLFDLFSDILTKEESKSLRQYNLLPFQSTVHNYTKLF